MGACALGCRGLSVRAVGVSLICGCWDYCLLPSTGTQFANQSLSELQQSSLVENICFPRAATGSQRFQAPGGGLYVFSHEGRALKLLF